MTDQSKPDSLVISKLIIKTLMLFLAANLVFALADPIPSLGCISGYNHIFPGRIRLPYGEKPEEAYNLSLFSLEAMFAAHELNGAPKPSDEYRVILVGDSSVWGFLLKPEDTLGAYLNTRQLTIPGGRTVRVYNLGYPTMSLAKDLLMLSRGLEYQPNLIIWLVTLESFPYAKQLASPILQHNPGPVRELIAANQLNLDPNDPAFVDKSYWDRTIIGERRALADILRLQLYGLMWGATGIDQFYPDQFAPPQENLSPEETFHDMQPPELNPGDLAYNILESGVKMAGNVPVLFVNEPIYISQGENSHIRYNFFYPHWAYDQYRQFMEALSQEKGWYYLDVWDIVPPGEFSNSAIHLTPVGSALLADKISEALLELVLE